jgi:hypothetical protein
MPHWESLRAAIAERGLSSLVTDSGEKAAGNLTDELERGRTVDNYDPLMAAHMAILNNVMGLVGIDVMMPNEDGSDRCPLCFLNADHAAKCTVDGCTITSYDHWIDKAADEQVEVWKGLNA